MSGPRTSARRVPAPVKDLDDGNGQVGAFLVVVVHNAGQGAHQRLCTPHNPHTTTAGALQRTRRARRAASVRGAARHTLPAGTHPRRPTHAQVIAAASRGTVHARRRAQGARAHECARAGSQPSAHSAAFLAQGRQGSPFPPPPFPRGTPHRCTRWPQGLTACGLAARSWPRPAAARPGRRTVSSCTAHTPHRGNAYRTQQQRAIVPHAQHVTGPSQTQTRGPGTGRHDNYVWRSVA